MRKSPVIRCAAILALALGAGLAQPPRIAAGQELKTLKERLSDKASDDQRVDNCRVPPERRGTTPRADCALEPQPPVPAAQAGRPVAPSLPGR
jgi:hypothetical protein